MSIQEEIQAVITAPETSHWLRDALIAASLRDPVDAANDAEVLSDLMSRRCAQLLGGGEGYTYNNRAALAPFGGGCVWDHTAITKGLFHVHDFLRQDHRRRSFHRPSEPRLDDSDFPPSGRGA